MDITHDKTLTVLQQNVKLRKRFKFGEGSKSLSPICIITTRTFSSHKSQNKCPVPEDRKKTALTSRHDYCQTLTSRYSCQTDLSLSSNDRSRNRFFTIKYERYSVRLRYIFVTLMLTYQTTYCRKKSILKIMNQVTGF